jgi:spermidine synthase
MPEILPSPRRFSPIALYLLVFFGGFANLATEIIGPRMFASLFGDTTIIWAIIIAVTLVGLSVGYVLGGRVERTDVPRVLLPVLVGNALWLVGVSWLIWLVPADAAAQGIAVSTSIILTTAMSAFFVPSVLFGMISPMVIALLSAQTPPDKLSRVVGNTYAIGTIGSVSGALCAALLLIPWVGLTTSLQAFALILVAFAAYYWQTARRPIAAVVALVCLLLPQPDFIWVNDEGLRLVEQREGYYQTIRVYTDDQSLMQMHLGPTFQSRVDLSTGEPAFNYAVTMMRYVGEDDALTGKRALVIGGAGHAMSRYLENRGAQVTEVEIDPIVVELSDRHFGAIKGEVVIVDGRAFIETASPASYDLILVDAFDGGASVPAQLTTREFFEAVLRALTPQGVMIYNFVGTPEGERAGSFLAISATMGAVFSPDAAGFMRAAPDTALTINQNLIFIASPSPTAVQDFGLSALLTRGIVLTDNLNPIDMLLDQSRTQFYFRR